PAAMRNASNKFGRIKFNCGFNSSRPAHGRENYPGRFLHPLRRPGDCESIKSAVASVARLNGVKLVDCFADAIQIISHFAFPLTRPSHQKMTLTRKIPHLKKLSASSGRAKCRKLAFVEIKGIKAVMVRIEPKHRHFGRAAGFAESFKIEVGIG